MEQRSRVIAATGLIVGIVIATSAGIGLEQQNGTGGGDPHWIDAALGGLVTVSAAVAGVLILGRNRRHAVGVLLLVIATSDVGIRLTREYAVWRIGQGDTGAAAAWAGWFGSWLWVIPVGALVALVAVFPTGTPLGPRWRLLPAAVAMATALTALGGAVHPLAMSDQGLKAELPNPTVSAPTAVAEAIGAAGLVMMPVLIVLAAASIVLRYRRGNPDLRRQILLVVVAASAAALSVVMGADERVILVAVAMIPVAVCVAVLRLRLYAVDRVVARALAFAALAAAVAVLYLLALTATGSAVASAGRGTVAAVAATAVVSLAVQPVKRRLDHAAHRFVHGLRPTREEVIASVVEAAAASVDEVSQRIADAVLYGLPRATHARVEVAVDFGGPVIAERARPGAETGASILIACDASLGSESVATLWASFEPDDPPTTTDRAVLEDIALTAAPALRNVALHAQLAAHARRLVSAQDEERLRVERDIHDGVQQYLIACASSLALARNSDGESHQATETAALHLTSAMRELRRVVHGIRPAVLSDDGVAAALKSHATEVPLPFSLEVSGSDRFPSEVESTLYWCAREALQNVTKHAQASHVSVEVGAVDGVATMRVRDDGCGLRLDAESGSGLRGMRDRLAPFGGTLELNAAPGGGLELSLAVPFGSRGTAAPLGLGDEVPAVAAGRALSVSS